MAKGYLSTFQVAELMSVSPDAVLKWIKSGKIKAYRTPGGHHRIAIKEIEGFLSKPSDSGELEGLPAKHTYPYCWEFKGQKNCDIEDCKSCLVYKTHARYCFEMIHLPEELGHLKRYCESSCQTCEYYNKIRESN